MGGQLADGNGKPANNNNIHSAGNTGLFFNKRNSRDAPIRGSHNNSPNQNSNNLPLKRMGSSSNLPPLKERAKKAHSQSQS